jgi:hypothetical protein
MASTLRSWYEHSQGKETTVDEMRRLEERVATGEISEEEYRQLADQAREPKRVHIPASAAWEAPSGEMTQIVGVDEPTTVVPADDPTRRIAIEDAARTVSIDPPR